MSDSPKVITCHLCGREHEYPPAAFAPVKYLADAHQSVELPEGWFIFDNRTYCPAHKVTIAIEPTGL